MTVRPLAQDPEVPIQGLTRDLYDALVDQGRFMDRHVELLEGEIVAMAPQGWPHSHGITKLALRLGALLGARHPGAFVVRQEKPLAATPDSEPEPDIDVVDAAVLEVPAHPTTAHLVIEMSDSSRRVDLAHKPRIYAAAQVPHYWVVDLTDRSVVVHHDPDPGGLPPYRSVQRLPWTTPLTALDVTLTLADVLG
ncbi:MAG: Uma2 family endonuclease [Kineosporiaceae bacterium]